MKSISLRGDVGLPEVFREASKVLRDEGLVCLPCGGTYRLVADLTSERAVLRLFQAKRRVGDAPTLGFVAGREMLEQMTEELDPITQRLIDRVWPGKVTILVKPELDLPRKLVKRMCKKHGKIGVRVPVSEVARGVVDAFCGPLLVSSANIEKKKGAYSAAQVRRNFFAAVELFLDAGDLPPAPASTVIDVVEGEVMVVREGGVSEEEIRRAAQDE